MILLLSFYYLVTQNAQAIPIPAIDQSGDSCLDISHCRTIWDIIWSCLTIIFSCTWLADHPDIPPPGQSKFRTILGYMGHLLTMLIAPELIIWSATQDWIAARKYVKQYEGV